MEMEQGFTVWLTGMSGAGKTTLANYLAKRLPLVGKRVEVLDMNDLGEIAPEEPDAGREIRDRNVRMLGWAAKLLTQNGIVAIVASVSPYKDTRDEQRRSIGRFFEVFLECSFDALMKRDEAGVYLKALSGQLQDVVGVQAPYELPANAEATVEMDRLSLEAAAEEVFDRMVNHGYLGREERDILVGQKAPKSKAAKARKARIDVVRQAAKRAAKSRGASAATSGVKAPKAASTKAASTKAASTKAASTKAASTKAASTKAASTKAAGTKAAGTKAASTKAAGTKAAGTKAASTKAASTKAASTKAASTKAAGTKAASTKAGSAKAASTKAASTKAASTKAASTKAASTKAAGSKVVKAGKAAAAAKG